MSLHPDKLWDWQRLEVRLLAKSKVVDGIHRLWLGNLNPKGYGVITVGGKNGKKILTHRLSAYLWHRLNLDDSTQQVNHKNSCPYKNCWNPSCIYVGSQKDNGMDRTNSEFYKCGHKKEGHYRCRECKRIKNRESYHRTKSVNR